MPINRLFSFLPKLVVAMMLLPIAGKGMCSFIKRNIVTRKENITKHANVIISTPLRIMAKGFSLIEKRDRDKAFEDAVAAYDRLIQEEERPFLYYYKIIALRELGSKRENDVRIAMENASRLGFIINS
jgi:hypothetical protein